MSSAWCATALGQGTTFTRTLHAYNDLPVEVEFSAWAPPELDRVKGVIFSIPGHGGNTQDIIFNSGWQERLRQMGFAIVGVGYTNVPGGGDFYLGTSQSQVTANMQSMLDGIAAGMGRPEISNAPIFPYGISHGGMLTNIVAQGFSSRTLGFFADKGATVLEAQFPLDFYDVPGLLIYGSSDDVVLPMVVNGVYQSMRFQEAEVANAVDWYGHGATSSELRNAYLDEVITRRYPAGQLPSLTPGNPLQLVDLPLSSGWLAETNPVEFPSSIVTPIEWPDIDPAQGYVGDAVERSWLPSETMAMVFRAHNSVPVGLAKSALGLFVGETLEGGPQLNVAVSLSVSYLGIDIYDESGLIHEFGAGSGFKSFLYTPTELGNQTFIAVAEYLHGGQPHFISNYVTYNVVTLPDGLPGDYNNNQVIDSADYSVWRDAMTAGASSLTNDPTPGTVDDADFLYWRGHFGDTLGDVGGGQAAGAVPEPNAALLAALGLAALIACRRPAPDS